MPQWSEEHRTFAVEAFMIGGESYVTARRKFCAQFKIKRLQDAPSEGAIRKWVQKLRATGSLENVPHTGPVRTLRTEETIKEVAESVRRDPQMSIRERAAAFNVANSTMQRILKHDLKVQPARREKKDIKKGKTASKAMKVKIVAKSRSSNRTKKTV